MLKEIASFINTKVENASAIAHEADVGEGHVLISPEALHDVCVALSQSPEFEINVLQVISGVDYEDRIEVNYMLASFIKNTEFILKVKLPHLGPEALVEVDSVVDIWKSANFQERECFDMLGVSFRNHPDLRRILTSDDWEGYPLRKDYEVPKQWHGIEINPPHKVNSEDHFFFKKVLDELGEEGKKKVAYSWKGEQS